MQKIASDSFLILNYLGKIYEQFMSKIVNVESVNEGLYEVLKILSKNFYKINLCKISTKLRKKVEFLKKYIV